MCGRARDGRREEHVLNVEVAVTGLVSLLSHGGKVGPVTAGYQP